MYRSYVSTKPFHSSVQLFLAKTCELGGFIEMLHSYDDKLKAFNAIENWCFVLITNIVLWRILLFFNRIVFDISIFTDVCLYVPMT
jgi:hypothetical protein